MKKNEIIKEKMEMDSIISFQASVLKIKQGSLSEAQIIYEKENSKKTVKHGEAFKVLGKYLQNKLS